jgi:hypothetical protein
MVPRWFSTVVSRWFAVVFALEWIVLATGFVNGCGFLKRIWISTASVVLN